MLPTTPPNLTAQGTILGTLQYMAPEQIEGLEADARTDIFAFGALLFEMLTGRTAFEGKTRASLLGAILKDEPPRGLARSTRRPRGARPHHQHVPRERSGRPVSERARSVTRPQMGGLRIERCRRGTAGDAACAIEPCRVAGRRLVNHRTRSPRRSSHLAAPRDVVPAAVPVQFTIVPPENTSFGGPAAGGTGTATQVAVSPDGRNIVFVAGAKSGYQIWLRPVATLAATPIPGTEGGTFPFWSPDSRFIGFFAGGKLKKVQIAGGPPFVLCDAPERAGRKLEPRQRDRVRAIDADRTGLLRVSSAGGVPTVVTTIDPADWGNTTSLAALSARWPSFPLHGTLGSAVPDRSRRRSESARSTRPTPASRFFKPSRRRVRVRPFVVRP